MSKAVSFSHLQYIDVCRLLATSYSTGSCGSGCGNCCGGGCGSCCGRCCGGGCGRCCGSGCGSCGRCCGGGRCCG
ncbi:unnamed protein product, partial [Rotaria sp. Silwood1]